MKYDSVSDLHWTDSGRTRIDCIVKFVEMKIKVPFTASPDDPVVHGREIYYRCVAGDFGSIGDPPNENFSSARDESEQNGTDRDWIASWPEFEPFLAQANSENAGGTPRGIILVWSSMIEKLLGDVLEAFIVDSKMSHDMIWKDSESSLNTFAGRTKICYTLGILSHHEMKMCDQIRFVRNKAAHSWNVSLTNDDFNAKVVPAMRKLYEANHSELFEWDQKDLLKMTRRFYASSCATIAVTLAERRGEVAEARRIVRPD